MKKFVTLCCLAVPMLLCLARLGAHVSSNSSPTFCCEKGCIFCPQLSENSCKLCEGCLTSPARTHVPSCQSSATEVVPAADLFYRQLTPCQTSSPYTIVFLHGLGASADRWLCQQNELCSCFKTVAFDLRGHGRSQGTDPSILSYTPDVFVDDIHAQLQQLNITQNIILVGHSMGGEIAIKYATTFPNEIAKLVLVSTTPGLFVVPDCAVAPNCNPTSCPDPFTCTGMCWPYGLPLTIALGSQALVQNCIDACVGQGGPEEYCNNLCWGGFLQQTTGYNENCPEELVNAIAAGTQEGLQLGFPTYSNIVEFTLTQDMRALLPLIHVPTLICYGSIDNTVNPGSSLFMHENISGSVLVEFVEKGHNMNVSDFHNFDMILKEFINSCSMPEFTKVFDQGCCVCPLVHPVDFLQDSCAQPS